MQTCVMDIDTKPGQNKRLRWIKHFFTESTIFQTWVNTTRPYTTTTNNQSCIGWKHPTTTSGVGCFGVHYIQLSKMLL